jgi:hypothetical protein
MGVISVAGLSVRDPRVTAFVVEVYSDSALTDLVAVQTAHAVYDLSTGLNSTIGAMVFDGLTAGTTYYLHSATIIPAFGRGDWSSTYSVAAGTDTGGTTGSITFGTGSPTGTAGEGALYFDTTNTVYAVYVYHSGAWHAAGGGGSTGGTFASGSNSNGYWVQDPTGHVHQWGKVTTDINSGTVSVTFPVAFASATGVTVNATTKSSTDRITFVVDGSVTASGFTVGNNGSGGFAYWEADDPGTASTATTLTNPMTAEGDLITGGTAGAAGRLAIGSSGKVLTSNGTDPAWQSLPVLVGDSGSGGTAGLVPAPAAGDAAAGKVLKADGTWYVPSGLSNPMTTAGDIIIGGTSGAATRLAKGSNGDVLTVSSGAVAWAAPSGGSSSGLVLLESHVVSAVSEIDFTAWYNSAYDAYVLMLIGIQTSAATQVRMQLGLASVYDSATNYHVSNYGWSQGGSVVEGQLGGFFQLFPLVGLSRTTVVSSLDPMVGMIEFFSPNSTTVYKKFLGRLSGEDSGNAASNGQRVDMTANYASTAAFDSIRIFPGSGTLTGTARLFGYAH